MAFLAKLGALTDELVSLIATTPPDSDRDRFNVYRESALRSLRHHNLLRTDPFEVQKQLDGLEERFAVQGREGLSAALRQRLDALSPHTTKWTPDILHFLLELSDQPAHNSRLSDLDLLYEPEQDPGPTLTWKEIAREDGWHDDRALWRQVDFHDSSDEGDYEDASSELPTHSGDSTNTSIEAQHQRTTRDLALDSPDPAALEHVGLSQSWRAADLHRDAAGRLLKTPISELQMLREVLFMLTGLPTTLFDKKCAPILSYQLANVSWDTYRALVNSFAECGRKLLPLRSFLACHQKVPLWQTFQDSVRRQLRGFDQQMTSIQKRFIAIKKDVVVSLASVLEEVELLLPPLSSLSDIVQQLDEERDAHAFRYLELLFEAVCVTQLDGHDSTATTITSVFFDCFQVYLRPIRAWMEDGHLLPGDTSFFVSETSSQTPLNRIWQDQFSLRQTSDGNLFAPKFLQPVVSRIFTTGKSVVVLKRLGQWQDGRRRWSGEEPRLDAESVWPNELQLAPFSELFGNAFDLWVQSKHHSASATLRGLLFDSCGLWTALDALQHTFLTSDGSAADNFAFAVFGNLDTKNPTWSDRFTLTEQVQEALSPRVDAARILAFFDLPRSESDPAKARASVRGGLAAVKMTYRMAWPVQLIVAQGSISKYQAVFTLLFQLRRALYLLNRHRLLDDAALGVNESVEGQIFYSLRSKLLWFCHTIRTYIANVVLAPSTSSMQEQMHKAEDVDAMIEVHKNFINEITDETCLGSKLDPIRECILDVLDLSIKLEDARRSEAVREGQELQDVSLLSVLAPSPHDPAVSDPHQPNRRGLYVSTAEEEEFEASLVAGVEENEAVVDLGKPYRQVLDGIRSDFDRHVGFIANGLRGVARASSNVASGKWDILAEMLEAGVVRADR